MSRENKYLKDFLNLLTDDQVFYSYLTNTFMLNQVNVMSRELEDGLRTKEEVEQGIQDLVKSLDILAPGLNGPGDLEITKDEFAKVLKTVKNQTIENLAERRKN